MLCRAGEQCGNRAVQLQTQPLLAVNQAGAVVATHDLEAGSFIGQYTGQVMTRDKFEEIKMASEVLLNKELRKKYEDLQIAKREQAARIAKSDTQRKEFVDELLRRENEYQDALKKEFKAD